jgi:hypothetical protein
MTKTHTYDTQQLFVWLMLLLGFFFLIGIFDAPERVAFDSHEVQFTDASHGGLAIMPASCSSSPANSHGTLAASDDGLGYISATGQSEYGVTKFGVSVCVTNTSGASYFVPGNTAGELNAVKAVGSTIPGLQIW